MDIEIKFNSKYEAPIGSPRPRFRNTGRFVQTYMPASYTAHKEYLKSQMPKLELQNNLKVRLEFIFTTPKSWSNKKRLAMIGKYKPTKPDIDNLIKTVLDAANNHLWNDDNQIVEIASFKRYGEEPKILMTVEEIE
ncbi:RusA family crossover junction endodeoxyribonuclease [Staphylococcus caprae]|uniref:RusA family crossover junction endodeoxyribonuclease n=1 Tax=Staphylococcus caprae TaxID=29380 RepID=UPI001C83255A|nr:RusA family crossover junction endodeoxyribonuclease [Staphylococcus caprae]MBX5322552.1 RusA family crossover junction endodeoxyribonuclease [Staphylococcus caprae]